MAEKTEMNLRNGDNRPATPLDAIRQFCLECCGYSSKEVKECTAPMCSLWEFRDGHTPYKKGREYTEEQRAEMVERMKRAREAKI